MFDHLVTPFVYAFGMFFTFYAIASIFLTKLDTDAQNYCDDAVHEFVDTARSSGYISPQSYVNMVRKMHNTGNLYDITICHESAVTYPTADENNNTQKGSYADSNNAHYQNEILAVLFPESEPDGIYVLKNGDSLKVSYSVKKPTVSSELINKFTTHALTKTIQGSYEGYVGSTGK